MRTDDQKIIAAIFTDLYSELATLKAENAALTTRMDMLETSAETHTPDFDVALVPAYSPPAAPTPTPTPVAPRDEALLGFGA